MEGIDRVPASCGPDASSTARPCGGGCGTGVRVVVGGGGGTLLGSGASATCVWWVSQHDARRWIASFCGLLVGVCLLFENCIVDASIL